MENWDVTAFRSQTNRMFNAIQYESLSPFGFDFKVHYDASFNAKHTDVAAYIVDNTY